MSAIANIIYGLAGIIHSLVGVYIWMVILAALMSWIPPFSSNSLVQMLIRVKHAIEPFLIRIVEPAYVLVRRYIPTSFNGIDLAPLVIIIGLQVADLVLYSILVAVASKF